MENEKIYKVTLHLTEKQCEMLPNALYSTLGHYDDEEGELMYDAYEELCSAIDRKEEV